MGQNIYKEIRHDAEHIKKKKKFLCLFKALQALMKYRVSFDYKFSITDAHQHQSAVLCLNIP